MKRNLALFLKILFIVSATELLIMAAFSFFRITPILSAFLDTMLLATISAPFIYHLIRAELEYCRRKDEALENTGKKNSVLLGAIGEGLYGMDMSGNVMFANKAAEAILGYPENELIGKHSHELFHHTRPDGSVYPAHECNIYATSRDGKPRRISDEVFWKKDGSSIPVEYSATPVIEAGTITGVLIAFNDITERKRAEAEQAKLAEVLKQSYDSVIITDTEGIILYVNPAFEKHTGFAAQEVLGKKPSVCKSGVQDAGYYKKLWDTIKAGGIWSGRLSNKRKDGSIIEMDAIIFPIKNAYVQMTNYAAVQRDISTEVALENQLRQSQKMESIGLLAGGIAHDFNNILMAITGYSQFLSNKLAPGSQEASDLEEIKKAADRAVSLTRQLLIFSRKTAVTPKVLDLTEVILNIQKMLKRLIGENIEFQIDTGDSPKCIKADPSHIEQVLLNLSVNAKDAMPHGGKLSISVSNAVLDGKSPIELTAAKPGEYVLLRVSDTGTGMSNELISKIFEPFFTTKGPGKGTGLGLSTVYGIVKQGGGYITVDSAPGKGSAFNIYFPAAELQLERSEAARPEVEDAKIKATILLVDDDNSVRSLAHRALIEKGFVVLDFATAEEALALSESYKDKIDLLLADVGLPGISGFKLSKKISEKRPGIKSVFMSGRIDPEILKSELITGKTSFLQKPVTMDILVETVTKAIRAA